MKNKMKLLSAVFFVFLASKGTASGTIAPDFSLVNWDGSTITLRELKGKTVLLTFSYAYCSVRCPIITGRLYGLDATMDSPGSIVYLHVSVDPDNDTPARRKEYFSLYGIDASKDGRWFFLSGQKAELSRFWKYYGVVAEKIIDKKLPEGHYIEVTPKVVLIDKRGIIRYEAGFDFSEDEMVKRIREIL